MVPVGYRVSKNNTKCVDNKMVYSLKLNLVKGDIDRANNLTAELMSNNGFLSLWDVMFDVVSENLMFVLSPNLVSWMVEKYILLTNLRNKHHADLYNCQEARNNITQLIAILCISPKSKISIPNSPLGNSPLSPSPIPQLQPPEKSNVLANEYYMLSQPKGTSEVKDKFRDYLNSFMYYISSNETKNTLYWIYQILNITDLTVNTPAFFPKIHSLKHKESTIYAPIWIIWNFIMIRVTEPLNKIFDDLIFIFNLVISRKNYSCATIIVFSALLLLKYQSQIKWDSHLPLQHHKVIKSVMNASINLVATTIP